MTRTELPSFRSRALFCCTYMEIDAWSTKPTRSWTESSTCCELTSFMRWMVVPD